MHALHLRAGVGFATPLDAAENALRRRLRRLAQWRGDRPPQRSLRLSFKAAYGDKKFDSAMFTGVPWGDDAGNREVDNIVLRAGNNHSFARSWNPPTSTCTEDEWYRATQIAMGRPGSPGRYVHLFINGIYWGMYNVVQRPDADFAASSLGGEKADWFSVNHGRRP
jgi:hypothetical protein